MLTLDERAEPGSARDERERLGRELEAILAGVADAVLAQDPDGTLVYVNDAAVRLLGVPSGYPDRAALLAADPRDLAARLEILSEDGRPLPAERLPGRRALAGEEPEPMTLRYRVRATGAIRWMRVKAQPVRDATGRVTRAINVVEDITDLKQVESTLRLLAEAGRSLAGSLDFEETLRHVASLAVPDLADWCMVDVFGERGLERMAVAHADPASPGSRAQLEGLIVDQSGAEGPAAAARTGHSELHPHVDETHLRRAAVDPRHHELVTRLGVRSSANVPLTVRGRSLGAMTLVITTSGRVLGAEQLAVLEELGRRAAVAIDSAQQYRQRSAIARTLQNSLLPPVLPEIPGLEAGAVFRPAGDGTDVGGDFYDLFSVAEDEWIAVDRRRLRQGRRSGGRDRARPLHDPHGGGAPALAGGDPALAQRRHAAPGPRRALLHDRLRAHRHVAPADPGRGGLRRPPARAAPARRRRRGRRPGRGRHAARPRRPTP